MVISIARKRPARKQLVRTLREHEEDVDGVQLTKGLIAERKAALHRCSDLRRKLEGPDDTKLIHTVRGVGYTVRVA